MAPELERALRRLDATIKRGDSPDEVIAHSAKEHQAVLRDWLAAHRAMQILTEPEAPSPPSIPGYSVVRKLGAGAMADVYLARQSAAADRLVAIKVLRGISEERSAGLAGEVEPLARLKHPQIVTLHTAGLHRGLAFVVTEYLEGGTLADLVECMGDPRRRPLPWRGGDDRPAFAAILEQFAGLARALDHAHRYQILHRDVKPSNIGVDGAGVLKLMDFGLATVTNDPHAGIAGTPRYMAPEQARGELPRPSADIHSLGATLLEALTGERFEPNLLERSRWLGKDLHAICSKCLRDEPRERYASSAALAEDLESHLEGRPLVARGRAPLYRLAHFVRRRGRLALIGMLLLALAALFGPSALRSYARSRLESRVERFSGTALSEDRALSPKEARRGLDLAAEARGAGLSDDIRAKLHLSLGELARRFDEEAVTWPAEEASAAALMHLLLAADLGGGDARAEALERTLRLLHARQRFRAALKLAEFAEHWLDEGSRDVVRKHRALALAGLGDLQGAAEALSDVAGAEQLREVLPHLGTLRVVSDDAPDIMAVGDLDGDGSTEIFARTGEPARLSILRLTPGGLVRTGVIELTAPWFPQRCHVVDGLTEDVPLLLLTCSDPEDASSKGCRYSATFFRWSGSRLEELETFPLPSASYPVVGDFNGDGRQEVLFVPTYVGKQEFRACRWSPELGGIEEIPVQGVVPPDFATIGAFVCDEDVGRLVVGQGRGDVLEYTPREMVDGVEFSGRRSIGVSGWMRDLKMWEGRLRWTHAETPFEDTLHLEFSRSGLYEYRPNRDPPHTGVIRLPAARRKVSEGRWVVRDRRMSLVAMARVGDRLAVQEAIELGSGQSDREVLRIFLEGPDSLRVGLPRGEPLRMLNCVTGRDSPPILLLLGLNTSRLYALGRGDPMPEVFPEAEPKVPPVPDPPLPGEDAPELRVAALLSWLGLPADAAQCYRAIASDSGFGPQDRATALLDRASCEVLAGRPDMALDILEGHSEIRATRPKEFGLRRIEALEALFRYEEALRRARELSAAFRQDDALELRAARLESRLEALEYPEHRTESWGGTEVPTAREWPEPEVEYGGGRVELHFKVLAEEVSHATVVAIGLLPAKPPSCNLSSAPNSFCFLYRVASQSLDGAEISYVVRAEDGFLFQRRASLSSEDAEFRPQGRELTVKLAYDPELSRVRGVVEDEDGRIGLYLLALDVPPLPPGNYVLGPCAYNPGSHYLKRIVVKDLRVAGLELR